MQGLTGSRQAGAIGAGIAGGFFTPFALSGPASYNQYMRETAKKSPSSGQASSTSIYTPSEMKLPSSLQELGGLTDTQKRSYLASQGAQGEGLGGSSRDYYINLLQRNIQSNPNQEGIDPAKPFNKIKPEEGGEGGGEAGAGGEPGCVS